MRLQHPDRTAEARTPQADGFIEFQESEIQQSIARHFQHTAEAHADRLAVKTSSCELSYRDLNHAANRIAHAILARANADEERVVLLVEPGASAVAAILGALKAGKTYVPLDPSFPASRNAFIFEDADAHIIVTDEKNFAAASSLAGKRHVLNIDKADARSMQNPGLDIPPSRPAYILYTSGSTGQPKGVLQNHRNVLNDVRQYTNALRINCDDRMTLLYSFSVNGAVRGIFGALLNGAALFPLDIKSQGFATLAQMMEREKITCYHSVPSLFRHFAATLIGSEDFSALRVIRFGGEPVDAGDVALYKKRFPDHCLLYTGMGATETGHIREYWIDKNTALAEGVVPTGYAIEDKKVLLLDEDRREVAQGEIGEIAVQSAYLAIGYWRKPELTKQSFLPDPAGGDRRIYLTGDIGRMLPDGCLMHLGRKDFQVKVRGFRIETAEIERRLREHPEIREAVLVAIDDPRGEKTLIAYLVANQQAPAAAALREVVKQKLPDYMVPARFIVLDAMPLTPNGKLDRTALPAPDWSRDPSTEPFVAPRRPIESEIARIWCEVLKREQISIHDNFFDLGGHSLLGAQIALRAREVFRVEIPLVSLFEASTIAEMATKIERASPIGEGQDVLPITRMSRDRGIELSFGQESLWFVEQLSPGSALYNIPRWIRISGALDLAALRQAFETIVARHESLRTIVTLRDGRPLQTSSANGPSLAFIDLRALPEAERESEALRLAKEDARRPFELAGGALMRASLLRLGECDHVLLLTIHHMISDAWSSGIFFNELNILYQAFSEHQSSPLEELPVQYADVASWQRRSLGGEPLQRLLDYWKKQLADAPAVFELPSDRPRAGRVTFAGGRRFLSLPKPLGPALRRLSRAHNVTLSMALLAVYQVLLSRYTNRTDIVVGAPIAGRTRPEMDGVMGYFINTLVLRTELSGDPTVGELLLRAKETVLGAFAHQDLPFEKLVQELRPQRNFNHMPLCQVLFNMINSPPTSNVRLSGLTLRPFDAENCAATASLEATHSTSFYSFSGTSKFDLALFMWEDGGNLLGRVEYNSDLFDASTIARLTGHYQTLLQGIVANPDQRLSALPMLADAERRQLLLDWNQTATGYSENRCVHQLFEAQVDKTPDAIAVVFPSAGSGQADQQLSYAELNTRANRLSHHLICLGVGPEVLVAVCVERSIEMIVGLLGILKAGGAYLPLDPAYPKERLAFMLEDSKAQVLITQSNLKDTLPEHAVQCVFIDQAEAFDRYLVTNPETGVTPDSLAYVIYTSGSTGKPKGVPIAHRGLCNVAEAQVQIFDAQPHHRILQFASLSFDAAIFEIVMAWGSGAALYLTAPDAVLAGSALLEQFRAQAITHATLPPSVLAVLPAEALPALQIVVCAGEACSADIVARWAPGRRFFNAYGPTEATIWSTVAECHADGRKPLIGRPIANIQVYLLDSNLNPIPIGVPGELHIGGAGLARGYLNRPELTKEKFIPNPFSDDPDSRLYKTGDLARYLRDGNIEFLGRIDTQVKIRGFRIEPGEIEAVLNQHPEVNTCAVIAREDSPGDKRLVAYVVAAEESAASNAELRGHLKQSLPDYMLPSAFVVLDKLPLTPNGKVDRRALPVPDQSQGLEASYAAPRTPNEEKLAAIFAAVLKIDKVGINDDFFDLGGHSLLATQLISRVRTAFAIDMPLRALFEAPTVAGLSLAIAKVPGLAESAQTVISRRASDQPLPLSFAQQRLWFLDQLEPASSAYHMPVALRLTGALKVAALKASLSEIVRRHEALRTTFAMAGNEPVQVIHSPQEFDLPVIDLAHLEPDAREAEALRLASDEAKRPFSLSCGPLFRARLIKLDDHQHLLALAVHHIVSDGWSMTILSRELSALYRACLDGKPSPLPELAIQYADYALWQRRWFEAGESQRQLAYWKQQLGGDLPVLELPTDWPRPSIQNSQGGMQSSVLSPALSDALKRLSQRQGVTLFMTLLAAFQLLLSRHSGQNDILVGTPIAGRNRVETEALIGFFISTLVLRTDLSGNPSFKELLARVSQVALDAYAHQELPFEKLVEELKPERSLSRNPIFDVLINFNNAPHRAVLQLPGASAEPLSNTTEPESKFALTFYIRDDGERLYFRLVYQCALFSAERMASYLDQLQYLCEQIVAAPEAPVQTYSLVTPAARRLLPDPKQPLIESGYALTAEMIGARARQTPARTAIIQHGRVWSYGELWLAAHGIAHALRGKGLRQKDVVAIIAPRSFGLIAGMLGVLLCGGVFLTIDRYLPRDRQRLLMREARARHLLLIEDGDDGWLDEPPSLVVTRVDEPCAVSGSSPLPATGIDLPAIRGDDPAYIFFTSGTTGTPKGILGSHKGLSHFLAWQRAIFAIGPDDRVAQLTSLSFDVLLRDVFLPLTSGASVHLPDERDGLLPSAILPWLAREQISVLHVVPTLAHSWLAEVSRAVPLPALRWVFFSGEPLSDTLVQRWRRCFGHTHTIVNLYGPTETTMIKCFFRVPAAPAPGIQPVGQALPETQALVLAENGRLCGIGESGEIVIRTPFRTLGYINAADEQRQRFIGNPFREDDSDLLYYTGDRGCYRPDGLLEIRGRLDDQVKIRGVRIEPEEVAVVLARHPAIESCAVIARRDEHDEVYLAAYIVSAEKNLALSAIRDHLSRHLPAAMLPAAYVMLDKLPLTANGKLDRKALPAPEYLSEASFVAPRTPNEETLAGIFAAVLKIDRVGIHDNFFELGGHSLLATQLISRVRVAFNVDLPLRSLFEAPNIAELASVIAHKLMENMSEEELAKLLNEVEAVP